MEYGAHLRLISSTRAASSLAGLRAYADTAARLGDRSSASDHLLFARPRLDGPTALRGGRRPAEGMTLATTVCLPVIPRAGADGQDARRARRPLRRRRLVVGVAAGSSARDYEAVGIPFEERWPRFEQATPGAACAPACRLPAAGGDVRSTRTSSSRPGRSSGPALHLGRKLGSAPVDRRVALASHGWLAWETTLLMPDVLHAC